MLEAILKVTDISKSYESGQLKVEAVKKTSFYASKGEIIVITGRSGSGKSTFLNMIGGLLEPDQGSVDIKGESLFHMKESARSSFRGREIGFIFQSFHLVQELNVLNNMRLPFDIMNQKYNQEYENTLIDLLGLGERLNFYPDQLSGGERQRVAISRALLTQPAIILADEPTGNLDVETGKQIMGLIQRTKELLSQTYIVVTHDLEWLSVADRTYTMADGVLKEYR